MSLYIVLEVKYVRNWKNETPWWFHYPMRDTKNSKKFGVFRPWSLDMRSAYAPHLPPLEPPNTPAPPRPLCLTQLTVPVPNCSCLRLATETHQNYPWEIVCLVDGVGEGVSLSHAPRFLYRIRINRRVWGFGLTLVRMALLTPWCRTAKNFECPCSAFSPADPKIESEDLDINTLLLKLLMPSHNSMLYHGQMH